MHANIGKKQLYKYIFQDAVTIVRKLLTNIFDCVYF
jgi:hypothetical protein